MRSCAFLFSRNYHQAVKKITAIGILLLITTILVGGAIALAYFLNPELQIKQIENHYVYDHSNGKPDPILIYLLSDGGSSAKELVAAWGAQTSKLNLVIASTAPLLNERPDVSAAILKMQQVYRPKLTVLVGFSSYGYFACGLVLDQGGLNNVAIVPLGAFCHTEDISMSGPALAYIPILSVVGELDDWARGRSYQ